MGPLAATKIEHERAGAPIHTHGDRAGYTADNLVRKEVAGIRVDQRFGEHHATAASGATDPGRKGRVAVGVPHPRRWHTLFLLTTRDIGDRQSRAFAAAIAGRRDRELQQFGTRSRDSVIAPLRRPSARNASRNAAIMIVEASEPPRGSTTLPAWSCCRSGHVRRARAS